MCSWENLNLFSISSENSVLGEQKKTFFLLALIYIFCVLIFQKRNTSNAMLLNQGFLCYLQNWRGNTFWKNFILDNFVLERAGNLRGYCDDRHQLPHHVRLHHLLPRTDEQVQCGQVRWLIYPSIYQLPHHVRLHPLLPRTDEQVALLFIYLSIYPSIYLSIYFTIHIPSIYLHIIPVTQTPEDLVNLVNNGMSLMYQTLFVHLKTLADLRL